MKLFELNDCAGVAATIFTDTDLTAHVGEVIQIGITCYTVAEYAGTLPEDIESVSGAFYETCEACDIPVYKLTPCVSGSAIYTEDDFSEYVGRTVYIGTTCYQVTEEGGLPITSPASPSSDHDSCENCAVYYRLKKCFNDADTDYYILASQIGDDEGLKIGDYCYYFDTENPLHKDEITGTPSYVTMASGDALSSCTNSICRYRQARRCSDEELSGYFMAVDDQIPFKYEGVCFYFDNADTPAQRESAEILGTILTPGMVEEVDDCEDSACVAGCVGDDSEWDYVIDGYEFGDVSTASCGGCAVNPDTGEWLGTWHGDPNGCVWKPTGGRLDNGHLVSSGNSTISFVTDRWVMIIQCSAGTIAWQGDKLTGTSPAGTYSRTGGCSATPSSLTIVAA
jgi:hypothetical protein